MTESLILTAVATGPIASIASEIVAGFSNRLNGTELKGWGAWILAAIVAFIATFVKVYYMDATPFPTSLAYASLSQSLIPFVTQFGLMWGASELFFKGVVAKLGMNFTPIVSTNDPVIKSNDTFQG